MVSILTACYNSTKYINKLLDSVLNQNYTSIQMILIDDGSTDNLLEFLKYNKYFEKFENENYSLEYYYQSNKGQASAIKNGLKYVRGNFLIWPDSDDFLNINQIHTMVQTFDKDSSIGIVRCYSNHIDENNVLQETFQGMLNEKEGLHDLFLDCLYFNKNMFFGAGNYMVKFDDLNKSLKSFDIFEHKLTGQNWQLILPVAYNYKCFTINEKLHNIVEYKNSHSRSKKSIIKTFLTLNSHKNTLVHTLNNITNINDKEREILIKSIEREYKKRKFSFIKSRIYKLLK